MATYKWVARVSIVLLGTVLIATTSRPGQRFLRALDVQHASEHILYDEESPFYHLASHTEPLRTDIILQSPILPTTTKS
jgi:hypothetical protein